MTPEITRAAVVRLIGRTCVMPLRPGTALTAETDVAAVVPAIVRVLLRAETRRVVPTAETLVRSVIAPIVRAGVVLDTARLTPTPDVGRAVETPLMLRDEEMRAIGVLRVSPATRRTGCVPATRRGSVTPARPGTSVIRDTTCVVPTADVGPGRFIPEIVLDGDRLEIEQSQCREST